MIGHDDRLYLLGYDEALTKVIEVRVASNDRLVGGDDLLKADYFGFAGESYTSQNNFRLVLMDAGKKLGLIKEKNPEKNGSWLNAVGC